LSADEFLDRLIVGDCLDILPLIPDNTIDMAFFDPPYGISYLTNYRTLPHESNVPIINDDESIWDILPFVAEQLWRIAKPHSTCFVFTRWDQWDKLLVAMRPWGPKNMIVWDKMNHTAGDLRGNFGYRHELIYFGVKGRPLIRGKRLPNIWYVPRISGSALRHPTEKPPALAAMAIETFTIEGDVIIDPFIGTGATAIAAKELGRRHIGIDIEGGYIEIANQRLLARDSAQVEDQTEDHN